MPVTKKNKPAFTLIVGAAKITVATTSITSRGKKLDKDIQVVALSAMQHHQEHGDVSLINNLVAGMPKGSRVNALRDFISVFGRVEYNAETKVFDNVKAGAFDLDGAMSIMWTEYSPEKADYVPITSDGAVAMIKMLSAKLTKDIEKMGASSNVDAAMLAKLNAVTVMDDADVDF